MLAHKSSSNHQFSPQPASSSLRHSPAVWFQYPHFVCIHELFKVAIHQQHITWERSVEEKQRELVILCCYVKPTSKSMFKIEYKYFFSHADDDEASSVLRVKIAIIWELSAWKNIHMYTREAERDSWWRQRKKSSLNGRTMLEFSAFWFATSQLMSEWLECLSTIQSSAFIYSICDSVIHRALASSKTATRTAHSSC